MDPNNGGAEKGSSNQDSTFFDIFKGPYNAIRQVFSLPSVSAIPKSFLITDPLESIRVPRISLPEVGLLGFSGRSFGPYSLPLKRTQVGSGVVDILTKIVTLDVSNIARSVATKEATLFLARFAASWSSFGYKFKAIREEDYSSLEDTQNYSWMSVYGPDFFRRFVGKVISNCHLSIRSGIYSAVFLCLARLSVLNSEESTAMSFVRFDAQGNFVNWGSMLLAGGAIALLELTKAKITEYIGEKYVESYIYGEFFDREGEFKGEFKRQHEDGGKDMTDFIKEKIKELGQQLSDEQIGELSAVIRKFWLEEAPVVGETPINK